MNHLNTMLAHLGTIGMPDDPYCSSTIPIYQTAAFEKNKQKGSERYSYSRLENPTRRALERVLALAEHAEDCIATNMGVGACAFLCEVLLSSGDVVIAEQDLYGGTYDLLEYYRQRFGVIVHYVDLTCETKFEELLSTAKKPVKLVVFESPTNPGLKIINIKTITTLAHRYGALVAVDNSLATFASQRPLDLGADFVFFSSTKAIAGHGAITGGGVVWKDPLYTSAFRKHIGISGRAQTPMDAYLVSIGIPSIEARMKIYEANAFAVARHMTQSRFITNVRFLGLETSPYYVLGKEQMNIIPGTVTVDFVDSALMQPFLDALKIFTVKSSFGSPDSRIAIPKLMSHNTLDDEFLQMIGISPATIRLSMGLENSEDLLEDLDQAFGVL